MVRATIEKDDVVIRLPRNVTLVPSKTGKSMILATTGGNQAIAMTIDGKSVVVKCGVNLYIPA